MYWVLFLLVMIRAQYTPYWIPSSSMAPTLVPGDYMIAGYVSPDHLQRGDVVVFRHPVSGVHFVKRLIGLPGDTVQLRNGLVVLNGTVLQQRPDSPYVIPYMPTGPAGAVPRCTNMPAAFGDDCETERFRETLPDGRNWPVLNIDRDGFADNTQLFTVPPGQAFLLGDNRDNSQDSRFGQQIGGLGFVPMTNIFAIPRFVIVSAAGASFLELWTWRASRLFRAIR